MRQNLARNRAGRGQPLDARALLVQQTQVADQGLALRLLGEAYGGLFVEASLLERL